jgi:hypothetical protein
MCKLFLFSLIAFVSSCASAPKINKHAVATNNGIQTQTIEASKGTGDITLLPHQLKPIDYLLTHPEIKGLLVNHYMGTGKTYLGLGFAQANKGRPVIILAPKFLESNWKISLERYGVDDPKRFTFVSYDDAPDILINKDLTRHILLIDEIHNLIKLMRSASDKQNLMYTKLYLNLKSAHRILGLTGTPVYNDESDLAFMVNLVSGNDLMPFNQESFRMQYTSILPARQFFRGYLLEGNMFTYVFPIFSAFIFGALFPPWGVLMGFPLGVLAPVGLKLLMPFSTFKIRRLDIEKMTDILQKYVSYFRFDESEFKDFPRQEVEVVNVPYNRFQYSFFIHLVEGDLEVPYLQRLLKDDKIQLSDEFVKVNSTSIHESLYRSIGAARDIGNFDFMDNGLLIEPPKFLDILKMLKEHNEQTVIYSNYYVTGTKAFEEFLLRQNFAGKFATIHPNLTPREVGEIVDAYNNGTIRVLLLHPDVTEGISLKGTQYLHVLEPIINSTVLEQVIGRTRRFHSHSHLPKEKQVVRVKIWQSSSGSFNSSVGDIWRANWFNRYREISYMSLWGIGLSQVDKKADRKALNPEEIAQMKLETLKQNLSEMQEVLSKISIEQNYR